ncbi:uroporphyrinogen-III synthase [Sphingobium xanthum]|uniref:uroporphyrinogen-III synthase n=1 Tax=Sphingobium xanthum TaxID=1387165 RepID=UPI001C8CE9C2|nr:uroporphyrinogen-III synthase [Sphingobium xanthum]
MNRPLVLLRPQPGNDRSAEPARALGLEVIQFPLFEIIPVEDEPIPEGPFDALLVTSASGARHGAATLAKFAGLPVFTVGEASAQAVRAQGVTNVHIGGGDAATTIPLLTQAGHRQVLHLCGEEVRPFDPLGLIIARHVVYRAEARDMRPFTKAFATLPSSVIAIHSPAAGRRLNALLPPSHRNHFLLAISQAALDSCGKGWRKGHVSPSPDDTALLRLATSLCMGAS